MAQQFTNRKLVVIGGGSGMGPAYEQWLKRIADWLRPAKGNVSMPATAVRPGSTGLAHGHPGGLHVVHLGSPALRTADGHDRDERRASWLELFFDLAFAGDRKSTRLNSSHLG